MSDCFVIKNQDGLYLNKQKEWVDGRETQTLFRCPHKDEAINVVFELSSKDISLRAEAVSCDTDDKRNPIVEVCTDLVAIAAAQQSASALEQEQEQEQQELADVPAQ